MEEAIQFVVEMHERIWTGFKNSLADMTPDEANWRPLPEANSINLILRHLRIEAAEHLHNLKKGAQSGAYTVGSLPLDFGKNLSEMEELFGKFVAGLGSQTLAGVQKQTAVVYQKAVSRGRPIAPHFLAFHQVLHLAMHWGQINTIRNLYRKTKGEPALFFPENPNFPQ